MTYPEIESTARQLVLAAMERDKRNIEDLDNPKDGSFISDFVNMFYEYEGNIQGTLLVVILKDVYGINLKI